MIMQTSSTTRTSNSEARVKKHKNRKTWMNQRLENHKYLKNTKS